jgi:hypothetical protein
VNQFAALGEAHSGPRPAVEGPASRRDGVLYIGGTALGHDVPSLLRPRVDGLELRAGRRRSLLAIDDVTDHAQPSAVVVSIISPRRRSTKRDVPLSGRPSEGFRSVEPTGVQLGARARIMPSWHEDRPS